MAMSFRAGPGKHQAEPGNSRAFAFTLELGVANAGSVVDPDSGMLLNLVELDAVLAKIRAHWQHHQPGSLRELLETSLQIARQALFGGPGRAGMAANSEPRVQRLCFVEKRGWFFGWENDFFYGQKSFQESVTGLKAIEVVRRWGSETTENIEHGFKISELGSVEISESLLSQDPSLLQAKVEDFATGEKWIAMLHDS